ncbi:MAG: glycosyltransferase [Flavobacteriales bacterium]
MQKKIKILYTIPNFDTAGSCKVVYDLVKGLDKTLFDVEIACNHKRGMFFKEVEALGLPIHILTTTIPYRPYFNLFVRLKPIIRFFKTQKYDIVHSWDWSSDWTEVLAAHIAGVKWIYTKKAMSWGNKHWKIRSFLADYIITINDQMQTFFPKRKKQILIPLGLDTDYYNPQRFLEQETETQAYHIITIANLVPVKGVDLLIHAISLLDRPNVKLSVLGDDTNAYGASLKVLCKTLNVEQQVHFFGKQSDVRPYLATANLYVIPTLNEGREEGMPMALVEAMSMGIPVLGSDVAGINFVLKDFPELLFEPRSEKDLVEKIKMVMDNSKALNRELGEKLRLYCEEHFSYQKFIEAHQELYKSLIR